MNRRVLIIPAILIAVITALVAAAAGAWTAGSGIPGGVSVVGGPDFDDGRSVAVDDLGNTYVTGGFQETADFDPGPGVTNLTSKGSYDVFVMKLDTNGGLVWARSVGGSLGNDYDYGHGIAVDSSGNIFVSGEYGGTADFDPGPGTANLVADGSDGFVLKLDSSGDLVWARSYSDDPAFSVAVDSSGSSYATGTTAGEVHLSKIDPAGNLVWTRNLGHEIATSVAIDGSGNVLVTGGFRGGFDFDPGPGTSTLTSNGSADVFVVKLSTDGDLVWARSVGGTGSEYGNGVVVDGTGNVIVAGQFEGTVDFDPGAGARNLTASGPALDAFVWKLDSSGSLVWAHSAGGVSGDAALGVAANAAGSVYVTGKFESTVDFDPGLSVSNLTAMGSSDGFIWKLDSDGDLFWARNAGDWAYGVAVDASSNVYVTGYFSGVTDFDPGAGVTNVESRRLPVGISSAYQADVFMLKLNLNGYFVPTVPGQPLGVSGVAGDSQVTVSWLAPADVGDSIVTPYTATASPGDRTCVTSATSCTISGLSNGAAYTFTVTAFNTPGTSLQSAPVIPMFSACHVTAPIGYWLVEQAGQIHSFGDATDWGSPALGSGVTAVDVEATSSGCGYWVLDSTGVFHSHGDATSPSPLDLSALSPLVDFAVAADAPETIVSMVPTSSGNGQLIFTSAGQVLSVGDGTTIGDLSGLRLNSPVIDAKVDPDGLGYWMLAADGGVFAFAARYDGSIPELVQRVAPGLSAEEWLAERVVGMTPDPDGTGYWLVAADGGVFGFNAPFNGSIPAVLPGVKLNAAVNGIVPYGDGYLLVAEDGGVFNFSDLPFDGSLGANPPSSPVVAITPLTS